MSKIVYLNNHLDQYRKDKPITLDLEEIRDLFSKDSQFGMTKQLEKILIKSFKDKQDFKIVQRLIEPLTDKVLLYSIITLYWTAFIVYYHNETLDELISNCLNSIDENVVLLDSPRYCKKVYFYLNSLELVN